MYAKFLIFVPISSLLVAAIYSSSTYFVFAEVKTSCTYTSKTTAHCTVFDTETGDNPAFNCKKNKDGKTWSCVQALEGGSSNPSAALKDALVKAQAGITTGGDNNTKVPKDLGRLNDGAVFNQGGGNTESNNTSTNSNATLQ